MTIVPNDDEPMRAAIAAARAALAKGNKPYGATLVSANGKGRHTAGNNELTGCDSTAHAESFWSSRMPELRFQWRRAVTCSRMDKMCLKGPPTSCVIIPAYVRPISAGSRAAPLS